MSFAAHFLPVGDFPGVDALYLPNRKVLYRVAAVDEEHKSFPPNGCQVKFHAAVFGKFHLLGRGCGGENYIRIALYQPYISVDGAGAGDGTMTVTGIAPCIRPLRPDVLDKAGVNGVKGGGAVQTEVLSCFGVKAQRGRFMEGEGKRVFAKRLILVKQDIPVVQRGDGIPVSTTGCINTAAKKHA